MWPQPIHHLIVISVAQRILQHLYNSAANGPSDVPLRFSFGWLVFFFFYFILACIMCVCAFVVYLWWCRRVSFFFILSTLAVLFSDDIINNNRFILQESIRAECRRPETIYINNSTKLRIPGPIIFVHRHRHKRRNKTQFREEKKNKYCAPL